MYVPYSVMIHKRFEEYETMPNSCTFTAERHFKGTPTNPSKTNQSVILMSIYFCNIYLKLHVLLNVR